MTTAQQERYDKLSYGQLLEEKEALIDRKSFLECDLEDFNFSPYVKARTTRELNNLAPKLRYVNRLLHKLEYLSQVGSVQARP